MDSESIYTLAGIVIFALISYFVLKNDTKSQAQTKEAKRYEIINAYHALLQKELDPLINNQEERIAKKTLLLKKFSEELSLNIFFDSDEIKEIIQELAIQS